MWDPAFCSRPSRKVGKSETPRNPNIVDIQLKAPYGGENRRPTSFSGGSRFGEALAVSRRGPVLFLARLSISRAVGMFWNSTEVDVLFVCFILPRFRYWS